MFRESPLTAVLDPFAVAIGWIKLEPPPPFLTRGLKAQCNVGLPAIYKRLQKESPLVAPFLRQLHGTLNQNRPCAVRTGMRDQILDFRRLAVFHAKQTFRLAIYIQRKNLLAAVGRHEVQD